MSAQTSCMTVTLQLPMCMLMRSAAQHLTTSQEDQGQLLIHVAAFADHGCVACATQISS